MKTRFPRVIRIGSMRLDVTRNAAHLARATAEDGPLLVPCPLGEEPDDQRRPPRRKLAPILGTFSFRKQRITVAPGLSGMPAREVLLHEVLHACWCYAGLNDGPLTKYEERVIWRITPIVLDALRSNPTFVAYLADNEKVAA